MNQKATERLLRKKTGGGFVLFRSFVGNRTRERQLWSGLNEELQARKRNIQETTVWS